MRFTLNPTVVVKKAEDILVGYLAASVVENDCWKEEVAYVVTSVGDMQQQDVYAGYRALKAPLEKEFKSKNNLKAMPGKYRSAKSIICKALSNQIELLDADGFPRGKTEVEKELKMKSLPTLQGFSQTSDDKVIMAVNTILNHWGVITDTTRDFIRTNIQGL